MHIVLAAAIHSVSFTFQANTSPLTYHKHSTTEYKESATSGAKEGRVVEICNETDGLGCRLADPGACSVGGGYSFVLSQFCNL